MNSPDEDVSVRTLLKAVMSTEPSHTPVRVTRRQGFVSDKMPLKVLIERHLPMEYRMLLIPVATSGNRVILKM
ncbi:centromere protein T [Acipenser oxyrinchus oxyrinchus]|uniref:Centromere protein T n=1 Tax=Acipenser oxyrinchus oxyrinchus TaxID=40147 RepID=A0AAD8D3L7_ACIOX|nr:centromere protein T [Acipenser oxyrinchus oxyrinchus]